MQLPTMPQVNAFGRHVVTYSMGAVTALAVLHVLSPGDATSAGNAITQISSGVASIIAGLTTLIGIVSGLYAAFSASPLAQLLAASKVPGTTIITEPTLANAVPATNVVPADKMHAVLK